MVSALMSNIIFQSALAKKKSRTESINVQTDSLPTDTLPVFEQW